MRILGWLATIVGVVSIVACLAVAIGVWVVRPAVSDKVHEVVAIGSEGLVRADELAVVADEKLTTVSDRLTSITSVLDSVAGSPLVDTAVGSAIRDVVSGFASGPYAELTETFSGLRERVVTLSGVIQRLDTAIPGIELPGVVTSTVEDIDARLTQLDSTVASVEAIAGNGVTTSAQLTQLSTQVAEINETIAIVLPALDTARTQIAEAQGRLDRVSERADSILGVSTIVISLVFIWLALLNVLLFRQGRRWLAREA